MYVIYVYPGSKSSFEGGPVGLETNKVLVAAIHFLEQSKIKTCVGKVWLHYSKRLTNNIFSLTAYSTRYIA